MKKGLIAFLLMAVVGAGAVFIFAQKGSRENFGKRGFGGRGFARVAEKLNLSDEQKTQIETILEESKTRVKPLMETMRESRRLSENLDTDGTFNEEQVNQIAASQSEAAKQMFIEREKTKAQVFAVLTPEQRAEAVKMKARFDDGFRGKSKNRRGGKAENGGSEE